MRQMIKAMPRDQHFIVVPPSKTSTHKHAHKHKHEKRKQERRDKKKHRKSGSAAEDVEDEEDDDDDRAISQRRPMDKRLCCEKMMYGIHSLYRRSGRLH